jgi:phage terminase Nu1 subunit (DNA packaging protein)
MSTGGVKLGGTYDQARTRKVNAEAEIAELELARVRGELVNAEDVVKAWEDVLGAMKGKLLSIPTKAAPILAQETEPGICQTICEDLINEALEELSNYEPKNDPTTTSTVIDTSEESDTDSEATKAPKRKRVGRPKKTAGLANK